MAYKLLIGFSLLTLVLLLWLSSCCIIKDIKPRGWITYKIKSGTHSSRLMPRSSGRSLTFKADMKDAIYDTLTLGDDKYDWNKLYGITSFAIHENSWRIVFRYLNGEFEYAAYWYDMGARNYEYLGSAMPNKKVEFSINITSEIYFTMTGGGALVVNGKTDFNNYFRAFPYFGGNQKAPNDIVIKIKEY